MARSKIKGDVSYYKPQRLWGKKSYVGYKAWDKTNYIPTEEEIASGNYKVVEKRGRSSYYKRIENPNTNDTMIVNERPIAYSTRAEAQWLAEVKANSDSWEEVLRILEFAKNPDLITVVDAYIKCGAEFDEVNFKEYYVSTGNSDEWWKQFKFNMETYYADREAGRVSRFI